MEKFKTKGYSEGKEKQKPVVIQDEDLPLMPPEDMQDDFLDDVDEEHTLTKNL